MALVASLQTASALVCYSCKSSDNPNCGNSITNTAGLLTCTTTGSCVTFVNIYDNNAVWRDCDKNVWTPDSMVNKTNTCVIDSYSNELFCNCNNTDICNKDVGSKTIFGSFYFYSETTSNSTITHNLISS